MSNTKQYYLTTLALLALCLAFALMIMLSLQAGSVQNVLAEAKRGEMGRIPDLQLQFSNVSGPSGRAFIDRPLFTEDRRPPKAVAAAVPTQTVKAATPTNRPDWLLMGTVVTGDNRHALLMKVRSNEIIRVVEGMKVDNWEIASIGNTSLLIRSGKQEHKFLLPPAEGQ